MRSDSQQLSLLEPPQSPPRQTQYEIRHEKEQKILDHASTRMEILRRAKEARRLGHNPTNGWLRYRVYGMVTSDMVNESLKIPKEMARSRYRTRNNMNGMMFRIKVEGKERWKCLGRIVSSKEGSNGNDICAWVFEKYWDRAEAEFNRTFDERGRVRDKGLKRTLNELEFASD